MEKKTFSIPSISCGHCVNAIKTELNELDGFSGGRRHRRQKCCGGMGRSGTEDSIKSKLTEINYPTAYGIQLTREQERKKWT